MEGEKCNLGLMTDVTEFKKLQEQLFHSQKMERIGRLAGGIAHDFNNILTSIMGYSELLLEKCDENNEDYTALEIINNATERAAHLTKQLLEFSRGGKYNAVPLNINESIVETLKIVRTTFEKNVSVALELPEDIKPIEADKIQMQQVFSNILINAKDAIVNEGNIRIKTENVMIDEKSTTIYPNLQQGAFIKITISDNGMGMIKDVRERIFEPFFTTKGKGKGTGLGLSTVYRIIKNHRGYITVDSEPGKGSAFTIFLPVTTKKIEKTEKDETVFKGEGTILVIDDEQNVRDLSKAMLSRLGYKVLVADNGEDGVKIYKKNVQKIDLILLDMIMPKMGGYEAFLKLTEINPSVKIIIISGYSQDGKASEIIKRGALDFCKNHFQLKTFQEW